MSSLVARRLGECIFELQPITILDTDRRILVGEVELIEFKPRFLKEIWDNWQTTYRDRSTTTPGLPRRELVFINDGSQIRLFPDLMRGPAVYILQRFSDKDGYYATVRCILAPTLTPIVFVDPPINEKTGQPVLYD